MGGLDELALNISEVCLLVVRNRSDVVKEPSKLWRKDIRWKQFFGFDLILVLHHLFEALLIGLVPPG